MFINEKYLEAICVKGVLVGSTRGICPAYDSLMSLAFDLSLIPHLTRVSSV